jgi:phage terminase large subunit
MKVEFPPKLAFLFEPHRYKVAYGGRGGLKSWNFARALVLLASERKLRVLCGRETMKSIAESVHELLVGQINLLGIRDSFEVLKSSIISSTGSEFLFEGLRHNVRNIKSMEAIDIVWVEEAESVSKDTWDTLIPTVRKDGSEIWVAFNPRLETDDTYKRFVLGKPPGAVVVKTTWRDNPWFPEVLRIEMEHLREKDRAAYEHVWEGECRSAIEGAIFGEEMRVATEAKRICSVPVDRMRPVHTFWDLGYGDLTAIWFAQALEGGQIRIVDYLENRGKTIEWYCIQLQQKGYLYGTDWLPHDAVDAIIHQRLAADKSRSIEQLMRAAGRNVRIAAKLYVVDGINAARTLLPSCWFDAEKCADGLTALRHYQWGPVAASGLERREPLHDWASHGADAFRTLAVSIKAPIEQTVQRARPVYTGVWS